MGILSKTKTNTSSENIPSSDKKKSSDQKNKEKIAILTKDFKTNVDILKKEFNYPTNQDLSIRNVYIKSLNVHGMLFYIEIITNSILLEEHIVTSLLENCTEIDNDNIASDIINKILSTKLAEKTSKTSSITTKILNGYTALIIEDCDEAILMDTTSMEHRSIEKTTIENIIKGPKEAFVESDTVNRSLIRKYIRNKNLVTESIEVGELSQSQVSLMYIKDIVDEKIVERVRKKIKQIEVDSVQSLEILEQHIEERPYSLIPTILYTERADRAASYLLDGHVVLIMGNSPAALVAPATFWTFFHTGEEHYERWAYGNFIRIIRVFAFIIAAITPAFYIAITNFHHDMIPTDLLLAIASTRETIPFPVLLEILFMTLSFDLIREASIRVPISIGPTIGIVGALILGQAAVEANIVSPILVIVVSITGLASFAIPEVSFSYAVRIYSIIAIFFSASLGFLGLAGYIIAFTSYLVSIKSFGVPFFAPMAPHYISSKDTITRPQVWKEWLRPYYTISKNKVRKKPPKGGLNDG